MLSNPLCRASGSGGAGRAGAVEAAQHLLPAINLGSCRKWQCFVSGQVAEKEGGTRALSERYMIKSWACSRLDNPLLAKPGLLGSITEILHVNNVGKSSH